MTLSASSDEGANPYAAPVAALTILSEKKQLWSTKLVCLWGAFGCCLQAVLTVWVFSVLHQTFFGFIEPPYLHTGLTVGFTFAGFVLLLRKASLRQTVVASQVINATQWLTFVFTARVLHSVGYTSTRLRASDLWIFTAIFLVEAVVLILLSLAVFKLRSK